MKNNSTQQTLNERKKSDTTNIWGKSLQESNISELKRLVNEDGNIDAYYALSAIYLDSKELLPYALFIANKYNNRDACYKVFLISIKEFEEDKDQEKLNLAMEYLKKAVHEKHNNARLRLGDYYMNGKYVMKDTVIGKYLLEGGFDIK